MKGNYRDLFVRYMARVMGQAGYSFTEDTGEDATLAGFSLEETQALQQLAREAEQLGRSVRLTRTRPRRDPSPGVP